MKPDIHRNISIPDELAARCDGPDQFERFDNAARAMFTVSKEALLKKEAQWKREQAKKKRMKSD